MIAPGDPTRALLLRLARVELTEGDARIAAELAPAADWSELARLAIRGGIAGLIATHGGAVAMPRRTLHALTAQSLATQAQNRALLTEALALCAGAERQGLTLVPLKGIALQLAGVYPQLGMRAQCDIDLLTERSQIEAVDALIRAAGFAYRGDPTYALRHQHHLKYALTPSARPPLLLELHWTPFFVTYGGEALDAAALGRAARRERGGAAVRLLDPIDTLLSVSLHLAVHRYRAALKWLVDVAELTRREDPTLDPSELWRRAGVLGARRALGRVLSLAHTLLGAPPLAPPAPGVLGTLLARATPESALIGSDDQPSLPHRLAIDLLQCDHPRAVLANTAGKLAELLERERGLRLPWLRAGTAGRSTVPAAPTTGRARDACRGPAPGDPGRKNRAAPSA